MKNMDKRVIETLKLIEHASFTYLMLNDKNYNNIRVCFLIIILSVKIPQLVIIRMHSFLAANCTYTAVTYITVGATGVSFVKALIRELQ